MTVLDQILEFILSLLDRLPDFLAIINLIVDLFS